MLIELTERDAVDINYITAISVFLSPDRVEGSMRILFSNGVIKVYYFDKHAQAKAKYQEIIQKMT